MPKGIATSVTGDGFVTIDFIDPETVGPALGKLIAIGGAASIDVDTRSGPRKLYRVPEGNASEAGLIDKASPSPVPAHRDSGWSEALKAADPFAGPESGVSRPEVPVSSAYVGATPNEDVLGVPSIVTTTAPGNDGGGNPVAPLHSDVIATVAGVNAEDVNTPAKMAGDPSLDWSFADLKTFASAQGKDVRGIRSSKDMLALIES